MSIANRPPIQYVERDGVHIAYRVSDGDGGPVDMLVVSGFVSHLDVVADYPPAAAFQARFVKLGRVISFDRRGSGLSDAVPEAPTLEQRVSDMLAVLDAAGVQRVALVGMSEGGAASILFAATHPDRVSALILYGAQARVLKADDYEFGADQHGLTEAGLEFILPFWGQGAIIEAVAPSQAESDEARAFMARLESNGLGRGMLSQLALISSAIDVRDVARSLGVPTLVLHKTLDAMVNVRHGRWLAENIPGARLVELPGRDHNPWWEGAAEIADEVERFLTGKLAARDAERVLATVLFTDIVDSTATAARLGDREWRAVLARHEAATRAAVDSAGGKAVKSTGDGFLATFSGPAAGVRCAQAIIDSCAGFGVRIRAGLHTGECELIDADIGGIAVHIAARVSAMADAGEVLVSRTVTDLVAGSGLEFEDRGMHTLKGVPSDWQIFAVSA